MNRVRAGGLYLLLSALSLFGCESGQTGSASCVGPCQCEFLADTHLAKGTVTEVDGSLVSLHIDQILDEDPNSLAYLDQTIVGSSGARTACGAPAPALPVAGDLVFAAFGDVRQVDGGTERGLRTQPWADEVRVADGTVISLADALELAEPFKCNQRYASPCEDTGSDGSIVCSAARAGGASSRAPAVVASTLLLACALLRRRVRRMPK